MCYNKWLCGMYAKIQQWSNYSIEVNLGCRIMFKGLYRTHFKDTLTTTYSLFS